MILYNLHDSQNLCRPLPRMFTKKVERTEIVDNIISGQHIVFLGKLLVRAQIKIENLAQYLLVRRSHM